MLSYFFPIGMILREAYINDPATDTAWTNALVFSMIVDLLPCVQLDDVSASKLGISNSAKWWLRVPSANTS